MNAASKTRLSWLRIGGSGGDRRTRARDAAAPLAQRLLDAVDPAEVGRIVLDELTGRFDLDIANLIVVDGDARHAEIVAARESGADNDRLLGQQLSLDVEPSGVSTAVREGAAFAVYDAEGSGVVNPRLNAIAQVKSCAFVPVRVGDDVVGVVFAAVRTPRLFTDEELAEMQELVTAAGLAYERARAVRGLEEALDRERLVGRISLDLRSGRELEDVLELAVSETGRAARAARCFVRLDVGGSSRIAAQWNEAGHQPLEEAERFPVSNLAARRGETIAVADVLEASELADVALGDVRELTAKGVRSVLAAPIRGREDVIGVLTLHRTQPGEWGAADVALSNAVARELGIALETTRLLRDSKGRLAEQEALLKAAAALTSDLHFDTVLERLVGELQELLGADAADCWILTPDARQLVCRAVLGLPASEVGRRIGVEGTLGEAVRSGRPVIRRDFAQTEDPPPSPNYAVFAEVMDAPLVFAGEVRGVLGVCSREPGRFDEDHLRLIDAFASLASSALRNAEAYEASERQAQVERGFYRMAAALSETISPAETRDAVAQAAAETLGGDAAAVLRVVPGGLDLVGAHELPEALSGTFVGADLDDAVRGGKILASRELAGETRFGSVGPEAAAAGFGALLAVPLAEAGAEAAAAVLVLFRDVATFDDEQLELAARVGAAARGALERSDLYERERRSRALAQRLARAGRDLAGELDADAILDQAVAHAADMLGADGASVRLLEGDEVVFRAAAGLGAADALGVRAPSTAWLVGEIVQSRETRALTDVRADPRLSEADPMLAAGHAAYLGVPMIGPDGTMQAILAAYALEPRAWREEEADALYALAAAAGAARANAELYQGVSHEQQRSEAILANVADGIVAVDREGKVVLWNPAAERVTGVPASEALGRTPAEALGRPLEAEDGSFGGSRLLPIRRGGDEVWLSLSEAVMTDPAGAVAGRIFAFRDISAERSVEQMKTDFVSTVSHELRTPLTSIYGFAETLLRQDVLFSDEERATFLRYIATESERLTSIVDRLLSVAQLDTGDMNVQLAETDVAAVVNEAVRTIASAEGDNGHRFVVEVDEGPLAAEADREKLGQVLSHLLDNAVRYSPAGGTVTVAARRRDDAVEVSVEDEGIGIPHAEQQRIFRKFYRGDGAASGAVGAGATGLGLFLAEGLVSAMGGRLWVDSDEGRGSTFVFELRPAESER